MHGGYSSDDNKPKRDQVDTASMREKVKLARSEKWRILKNILTGKQQEQVKPFILFQTKPIMRDLQSLALKVT